MFLLEGLTEFLEKSLFVLIPASAGISFDITRAAGLELTFMLALVGSSNNVWSE